MSSKGVDHKGCERLLLDDPLALLSCFTYFNTSETDILGEAISQTFLINKRSGDLLTLCASEEIYSTGRAEQLFRQDSIYIVILQHFVKCQGGKWLYKTLRKPLRKIILSDIPIEIDKLRLPANEDLSINRQNLEATIKSVLDPIFENPSDFPPEIGALCKLLFQLTNTKFPGEGYKVLSGSVFLRFICPFISSPASWHLLTRTEIKPETRRKLILVAKVVQGIANENTEFNEAYMNQIQDLLLKYIEKLHKFYDRVTLIAPSLCTTHGWHHNKDRSGHSSPHQVLWDFFLRNYTNICKEIVQPLSSVYSGAEFFAQRLELIFYDELGYDKRMILNDRTKIQTTRAIERKLRELRKTHGDQLWGALLSNLVISLEHHDRGVLNANFFQLQVFGMFESSSLGFADKKPKPKFFERRKHREQRASIIFNINDHKLTLYDPGDISVWSSPIENSSDDPENTCSDVSEFFMDTSDEELEFTAAHPVALWLRSIECDEFYEVFMQANYVSISQLAMLNEIDLIQLGVEREAVRKKMLVSLQSFIRNQSKSPKHRKKKRKKSSKLSPRGPYSAPNVSSPLRLSAGSSKLREGGKRSPRT